MMSYSVELSENKIVALYNSAYMVPPVGAMPVSNEIGETLRHCSNFAKYEYANGALSEVVLPEPVPKTSTSLQFMDRFTEAEQLAIVSATMVSPQVKLWYDRMIAATEIIYKDPRTIGGLQALVAAGLITQARMDEILPEAWR